MMYVSLHDLGLFLLFTVIILAGIFMIITLINVNRLVTGLNRTFTRNQESIQDCIDNMTDSASHIHGITESLAHNQELFDEAIPGSINNFYEITETMRESGEKIDESIGVVSLGLMETADVLKNNTQDVLNYTKLLSEIIRALLEKVLHKK